MMLVLSVKKKKKKALSDVHQQMIAQLYTTVHERRLVPTPGQSLGLHYHTP